MSILIIVFGILMLVAGITLVVNPESIFKILRENTDKLWLYISAVVVRLLLGVLLIYQASESKFPLTMEVIGWIAVVAAIVFMLLGRERFKRLISWVFSAFKAFGRIAGCFALGFGGFLIYAFV